MLISIRVSYINLFIFVYICLVLLYITKIFKYYTNYNILFNNIYKITRFKLYQLVKQMKMCLVNHTFYCCMSNDFDVYNSLYSKEYYLFNHFNNTVLNNFKYNNNLLLYPTIKIDYDIIIGIPVSFHHLSRRIAIRETYGMVKKIKDMNIKLYFILCYSSNDKNIYPYSLLEIESRLYNDILVFNITNSYKLLILQMLLFYQYIIKAHKKFKYYIRLDSDVFFNPYHLQNHIKKGCDVVGDKGYSYIPYVGGPFQIFNYNSLQKLNKGAHSVRPIIVTEDLYTGIVLSKYNITFCYVKKEFDYMHLKNANSKYIFNRNFTVIHKITSSGLIYLYKYYTTQ